MAHEKPIELDCSYADEHRDHHVPHPDSTESEPKRKVCLICHPPFVRVNGEWRPLTRLTAADE